MDARAAQRDVKEAAQTLNVMIDPIVSYERDCRAGYNSSRPQKNKLLPKVSTDRARTDQTSAEREEMHRKSGHHTLKWNATVRGSEGRRTPCPGKHGITTQITLSGSERRAPAGKAAALPERNMSSFIFTRGAPPITQGKYFIFQINSICALENPESLRNPLETDRAREQTSTVHVRLVRLADESAWGCNEHSSTRDLAVISRRPGHMTKSCVRKVETGALIVAASICRPHVRH